MQTTFKVTPPKKLQILTQNTMVPPFANTAAHPVRVSCLGCWGEPSLGQNLRARVNRFMPKRRSPTTRNLAGAGTRGGGLAGFILIPLTQPVLHVLTPTGCCGRTPPTRTALLCHAEHARPVRTVANEDYLKQLCAPQDTRRCPLAGNVTPRLSFGA